MNHMVNHFMQSTSHNTTSQSITPFAQLQFPQQQLMQVLPYGASKAFCLNALRAQQIQFLNLGSMIYCINLNVLLQFEAKRLVSFQVLKMSPYTNR